MFSMTMAEWVIEKMIVHARGLACYLWGLKLVSDVGLVDMAEYLLVERVTLLRVA